MTRQEAKQRAELVVYADYSLGDILYHCHCAGIKTADEKGIRRDRSELEEELIEHYIKKMLEGAESFNNFFERCNND